MTTRVKAAIAGIGNNVSALAQGVYYYRALKTRQPDASLPAHDALRLRAAHGDEKVAHVNIEGIGWAGTPGFVEEAEGLLKSPPGTRA